MTEEIVRADELQIYDCRDRAHWRHGTNHLDRWLYQFPIKSSGRRNVADCEAMKLIIRREGNIIAMFASIPDAIRFLKSTTGMVTVENFRGDTLVTYMDGKAQSGKD